MTLAAQHAHLLDDWLRSPRLAVHYHRRLSRLINPARTLAATADFRFPATDGQPTVARQPRLGNYIDHLLAAGVHDPLAEHAFLNVLNMVRRPPPCSTPSWQYTSHDRAATTLSPLPRKWATGQ